MHLSGILIPDTYHGNLTDHAAAGVRLLGCMLVAFDSAEKGLINFDWPFKLRGVGFKGFSQPMG